MRVAAIYDIHGHLPALDAVLAEIDAAAPDLILVGGDVAAGPHPAATLDRLIGLGDRARFVRGNADREVVSRFDGAATEENGTWALRDAWAAERLSRAHRDFLAGFEETIVVAVDGLGTTLFCHGSPRSDEEIFTSQTQDARLRRALGGVTADVVVCGHTHMQFDRSFEGIRIVNPGSVGLPYEGVPGAYWALLGPDVTMRRTLYDFLAAADGVRSSGWPESDEYVNGLYINPSSPQEAIEFVERLAAERDEAADG